tara:strand:+ start:421 stop:1023 length:603 start_codon:yes stop_codon:yes gene_type:complete
MDKIREILIGTNNIGKYQEICDLLPAEIKKYTPKKFKLPEPYEGGKTFEENSIIKASYYSKKTNLICLSDDSGLEVDVLNGNPGIHSARWGGENKNFSQAIEKVLNEIKKIKNPPKENFARFICCLTLFWPNGKSYTSKGVVEGKISMKKKETMVLVMIQFLYQMDIIKLLVKWTPNLKFQLTTEPMHLLKLKIFLINKL